MMASVMVPVMSVTAMSVFTVAIVTVCSTVYLKNYGAECDDQANTDSAEKHQSCPLRLI